jgi:hypothetical protein
MDTSATVTLTFTGTAVSWIGVRDEWSGIASVTLDGVTVGASVDTYLTPGKTQATIHSLRDLAPGTHTLVINVLGRRNSSSGGSWVWIDGFDVTR